MSQLVKDPKEKSFFTNLAESPSTNEFIKGIWKDNPVFVQVFIKILDNFKINFAVRLFYFCIYC